MLTSLGSGALSLVGRRFLLTIWLPALIFWAAIGSLAITGVGWRQANHWWLKQQTDFKIILAFLGLAWITFFGYLLAAQLPTVIRLAEGYWPRHQPWKWLAGKRIKAHSSRQVRMKKDMTGLSGLYLRYPLDSDHVMPTRLGNILRSAEDHALDRYKIDTAIIWPRLYVLLPDRFAAAIAAARTPFDLMITVSALAALFAAVGAVISIFLLPWYAILACFFGGAIIAWLSYRGAVEAAYPYGQLIRAAFDVYRSRLLDEMRWTRPRSYGAERNQWEQISHLWYQGAPSGNEGAALLGYPTAPVTPVTKKKRAFLP